MKLFRKLAAAALAGVMALSLLTDTQKKAEDYMVVFAKIPEAQDGGEITLPT